MLLTRAFSKITCYIMLVLKGTTFPRSLPPSLSLSFSPSSLFQPYPPQGYPVQPYPMQTYPAQGYPVQQPLEYKPSGPNGGSMHHRHVH